MNSIIKHSSVPVDDLVIEQDLEKGELECFYEVRLHTCQCRTRKSCAYRLMYTGVFKC